MLSILNVLITLIMTVAHRHDFVDNNINHFYSIYISNTLYNNNTPGGKNIAQR